MLKRPITYKDFNDNEVTEDFYFNMSANELVEMEVSMEEGFGAWIQSIIDAKDFKVIVEQMKKLILSTYGIKSEDGKRFIKTPEARDEFAQSAAFDQFFVELATDESAAADFIKGVLPQNALDKIKTSNPAAIPNTPV